MTATVEKRRLARALNAQRPVRRDSRSAPDGPTCRFCGSRPVQYDRRVGHSCLRCRRLALCVQRRREREPWFREHTDGMPIEEIVARERHLRVLFRNARALDVHGDDPKVTDPGPGVTLWDVGIGPLFKLDGPRRL